MDPHIAISITAALVNLVLSLVLPALLKDSKLPFAAQIKESYECNRDVIVVSTILTVIFVYIALKVNPTMETSVYTPLAKLLTVRTMA
jgi:hypothetical protein